MTGSTLLSLVPDLPRTMRIMEQAQDGELDDAVAEQARREIADCGAKLRQPDWGAALTPF
jgi:hypothetical protein